MQNRIFDEFRRSDAESERHRPINQRVEKPIFSGEVRVFSEPEMHRQIPQINRVRVFSETGESLQKEIKFETAVKHRQQQTAATEIKEVQADFHNPVRFIQLENERRNKTQNAENKKPNFISLQKLIFRQPAKSPEIRQQNSEKKRINPQMRRLDKRAVAER